MKKFIAGFVALLIFCCAYASDEKAKQAGAEVQALQAEMLKLQIQNNQTQIEILKTLKEISARNIPGVAVKGTAQSTSSSVANEYHKLPYEGGVGGGNGDNDDMGKSLTSGQLGK